MKNFLACFLLLVMVYGCEKDSVQVEHSPVSESSWNSFTLKERIVPHDENQHQISEISERKIQSNTYQFLGTIKNPETGETIEALLDMIPDQESLEKFLRLLKEEKYEKIVNTFSGILVCHSMDNDAFIFGGRFKNGKLLSESKKLTTELTYCDNYIEYTHNYIDWYVNGVYVGTSYEGTTTRNFSVCYASGYEPTSSGELVLIRNVNTSKNSPQNISVIITHPCIKKALLNFLKSSNYLSSFINYFDSNDKYNLVINEYISGDPNAYGTTNISTYWQEGTHYDFTISFNINKLTNTSQDLFNIVLFHEMLHVFLRDDKHIDFGDYFQSMVSFAKEVNPNLTTDMAKSLALIGLYNATDLTEAQKAEMLSLSGLSEFTVLTNWNSIKTNSSTKGLIRCDN